MTDVEYNTKVRTGTWLVEFGADWCVPCKNMQPILQQLAGTFPKVQQLYVDVDKDPRLAAQVGISGLPTMVLYHNGQPVKTLHGAQSLRAISKVIQEYAA